MKSAKIHRHCEGSGSQHRQRARSYVGARWRAQSLFESLTLGSDTCIALPENYMKIMCSEERLGSPGSDPQDGDLEQTTKVDLVQPESVTVKLCWKWFQPNPRKHCPFEPIHKHRIADQKLEIDGTPDKRPYGHQLPNCWQAGSDPRLPTKVCTTELSHSRGSLQDAPPLVAARG